MANHQYPQLHLEFGQEIEIADSGFSFHPIEGFELEIDGSVYMYSEYANIEIYMLGGDLEDSISIAELNDELTAECMEDVGEFDVYESGPGTIQGITGFLNEIHFSNAEEEKGLGVAFICSPHINQFFFILVIANADFWQEQGLSIFNSMKTQVSFQRLFRPEVENKKMDKHADLTIESYETIDPDDDFVLSIERGDVSLLLAAHSLTADEVITITEITAPGGKPIHQYTPENEDFNISNTQSFVSNHGEVVFFYPRTNLQQLIPGHYQFRFKTVSGKPIQEIQIIIRSGRALETQKLDFNLWYATEDSRLLDPEAQAEFEAELYQVLQEKMAPLNITPGKIAGFHPAPDELESFMSVNADTDLADCSYMIAESISNMRAINVGFVEHIIRDGAETIEEVDAISCGAPGMIMASGSPHACILVRFPAYQDNIDLLVDAILQQVIIFCGIDVSDIETQPDSSVIILNKEVAWRLRRHPVFYDAD